MNNVVDIDGFSVDISETSLTGEVNNITYQKSGFIIFKVKNPGKRKPYRFGVSGSFGDEDITGADFVATGKWENSAKFGWGFKFSHLEIKESSILYFLNRVVKVPKLSVIALLKEHPEDEVINIIKNRPNDLLKIRGIQEKTKDKIVEAWSKYAPLKVFSEALMPFGASLSVVQRVFDKYDGDEEKASEIVKNPYMITDVSGIGFKKADEVARGMGFADNDLRRLRAAMAYVVMVVTNDSGYSRIDKASLFQGVFDQTQFDRNGTHHSITMEDLERAFTLGVNDGVIKLLENGELTTPELLNAENLILDQIQLRRKALSSKIVNNIDDWIKNKETLLGISLSDEQKIAIKAVNSGHKIFSLCGYAGTGKSTIAKLLLDLISERGIDDSDIICCALSGIAADRIRKTTGRESTTIASLLVRAETGRRLKKEVVLIDESSMINSTTMSLLLDIIPVDAYVIFVGDPAQLPPIGAGQPFSDIIFKKLTNLVELTKIYRQSEEKVITFFANQIRQGVVPDGIQKVYEDFEYRDRTLNGYYQFRQQVNQGIISKDTFDEYKRVNRLNIQSEIINLSVEKGREMRNFLTQRDWIGYLGSFQIVSPQKRGELGVNELNKQVQKFVNPQSNPANIAKISKWKSFHRFDKVVHIKNEEMKCLNSKDMAKRNAADRFEQKIFNGMLGVVSVVDKESIFVYYPQEDIHVEYSLFDAGALLDLAYALTVHKTQGAEFKEVIMPLTTSHWNMLNNKLSYTAITRAKEKVYLIGESQALNAACTNVEAGTRNTILQIIA